ncbi:Similar to SWI/SNF chromatin-remodeling complex subunit snf5; acc. no. Q09699 [Pyronema omphalodes CBS 100304]|uniref:Similar to SWI/SNF chromatin-remodeling complex subunit snf5 acc. no. Q09699 n=1 Tax=Pyronema omphalodes (strain CBS 100304) TaxID=1076935 RepID=U4L5J5_PYROM|nr:Similar to SWI/SNF chromatin-remodeling complex subunit snf5; acc. no. Q09699 [Pyronema omphalodes CBS 100304]
MMPDTVPGISPPDTSQPVSLPGSPISDAPTRDPLRNPTVAGKDTTGSSSRPTSSSSREPPKERASTQALHLEQYIHRDLLHSAALLDQNANNLTEIRNVRREIDFYHMVRRERARNPGAIFGMGYSGYGNGHTDGPPRVIYPCMRKRPGGRKARELRLSRAAVQEQAEQLEMLVPVRLDIDYNQIKLRDTFTYNMHERTVPLEIFVEQLVEDFHLPLNQALIGMVSQSIREQVTDYHPHIVLADEPLDPVLPYTAYKNDDMRILIKLNITIGQHTLVDQFEWDINNPANSPEDFAMLLTRDLSLSGEFTTAIAHSIREQCQLFTKALYVTNHPFDGRPVEDEDVRSAMLQSPIPSVFRPYILAKEYTPLLYELSENELDRAEKSQSREQRRLKRRVNRRGGPTIPDLKDMPKTHRTQIVSSVLPGAVQKLQDLEKLMSVKPVKDGDSDDDESESEQEDLPPEKTIPGYNNMTRRQRLAAINAKQKQAEMRSMTPEVHTRDPRAERAERYAERSSGMRHETPATPAVPTPSKQLPRRPGVPYGSDSALLTIRIAPSKLRRFTEEMQRKEALRVISEKKASQKAVTPTPQPNSALSTPAAPGPADSPMPPPPTVKGEKMERMETQGSPAPAITPQAPAPSGADKGDEAPAPPSWLTSALARVREQYEDDRFEAITRKTATDSVTGDSIPQASLANYQGTVKWTWVSRIKCFDCPGKLYTPGPEPTVDHFLVHIKNRLHREKVAQRLEREAKAAAGGK